MLQRFFASPSRRILAGALLIGAIPLCVLGAAGVVTGAYASPLFITALIVALIAFLATAYFFSRRISATLASHADQRRRLEEMVAHNERMDAVGMLAGGIAHDLNNILGYLLAYTDLVEEAVVPGGRGAAHIGEIRKAIDRATDLVSQIHAFSRRATQEKRPIRVAALIGELTKMLRATIPKVIAVRKEIRNPDIHVMAEPLSLHQILMNLCTNALHAMQDTGGTLTLTLEEIPGSPSRFRLTVRDTGCGMDETTRRRACEPFFTTKPPGQGTGMGLHIVATTVQNLGGTVEIESEVGRGTAVHLILPAISITADEKREDDEGRFYRGSGEVLFVDDEEHYVVAMKPALESLGYTVAACTDSREALMRFRERPIQFDVVVTDFNMPGMNGLELARRIKMTRPCLPIVLITGYTGWEEIPDAARLGIEAVLQKPFSRAQLSRALHEVLQGRLSFPAHRGLPRAAP